MIIREEVATAEFGVLPYTNAIPFPPRISNDIFTVLPGAPPGTTLLLPPTDSHLPAALDGAVMGFDLGALGEQLPFADDAYFHRR